MLTKNLILCRVYKGNLKPSFIKTDEPRILSLAEQLLMFVNPEDKPTRGDINESATPVINSSGMVKVAQGLQKLILDRAEFTHPADENYQEEREKLFLTSAELLRNCPDLGEEEFRDKVESQTNAGKEFIAGGIYADLPENEQLTNFKSLTAQQLLERYNLSLVQSLLLQADSLKITVKSADSAQLRRCFKYLRFFRLLADITVNPKEKTLHMEISGPASVLEQSRKYGLQLASFFPVVCSFPKWSISAEVNWKNNQRTLELDQKSNLICPYRNFSAYVPEEIRLFREYFQSCDTGWKIVQNSNWINTGRQNYIFPDATFKNPETKEKIHLELFHRWHATQLKKRIEAMKSSPCDNLIIGVDRFIAGKTETAELLANSEWFRKHGFEFRDYPTVNKVKKLLNSMSE